MSCSAASSRIAATNAVSVCFSAAARSSVDRGADDFDAAGSCAVGTDDSDEGAVASAGTVVAVGADVSGAACFLVARNQLVAATMATANAPSSRAFGRDIGIVLRSDFVRSTQNGRCDEAYGFICCSAAHA